MAHAGGKEDVVRVLFAGLFDKNMAMKILSPKSVNHQGLHLRE
jgi:hypothetical protein